MITMFIKGVLLISLMVLYMPHELFTREIQYNVPRQLRVAFMSASGRYREFQAIDCTQPVEMDIGCGYRQLTYRWHWDHEIKSCERFPYFGCEPTRNNFYSSKECDSIARPVCTKLPDSDRYKIF